MRADRGRATASRTIATVPGQPPRHDGRSSGRCRRRRRPIRLPVSGNQAVVVDDRRPDACPDADRRSSLVGRKVAVMIESVAGFIRAAPTPWPARAAAPEQVGGLAAGQELRRPSKVSAAVDPVAGGEPGSATKPPLPGLEEHDGDLPRRPPLVGLVARVRPHEGRPKPLALGRRGPAGSHRPALPADLHLDLGLGLDVQKPRRVGRRATGRGHDDEGVPVPRSRAAA